MKNLIKNPFMLQKVAMAILGVVFLMALGCEKSEETQFFWEIPLNTTSTVINNRIKNIEFKFCLLNEKGVPSTRFKEGENFSFHFEVINRGREELYLSNGEIRCNIGDYPGRVISLDHDTISSDFASSFIMIPFVQDTDTISILYNSFICPACFCPLPFYGKDNKSEVTVPWNSYQRGSWDDEIGREIFQYPPLSVGEYYTIFSPIINFMFYDKTARINHHHIGPIIFKINFKIEKNHENILIL